MDSMLNPFETVIDASGKLFSWADAAREGGFDGDATKLKRQDEKVQNTFYEIEEDLNSSAHHSLGMQGNAIHSWLYEKKRALRVTMNVVAAIATWDSQTRRGVW